MRKLTITIDVPDDLYASAKELIKAEFPCISQQELKERTEDLLRFSYIFGAQLKNRTKENIEFQLVRTGPY